MSARLKTIRSVIDRVLWTAGATKQNRALLAEAIDEALPADQPSNPVPLNDEHRRARKAIQDVIAQLQVLHEGRDPIMAAIITTVALLVDDDLQTVADFLGADTGARIVGQQTKGGGNG